MVEMEYRCGGQARRSEKRVSQSTRRQQGFNQVQSTGTTRCQTDPCTMLRCTASMVDAHELKSCRITKVLQWNGAVVFHLAIPFRPALASCRHKILNTKSGNRMSRTISKPPLDQDVGNSHYH